MAKTKEKKAPEAEETAEAAAGKAEAEKPEAEPKKKAPKEGGGVLLTILTVLLVLVGVGEVILLAFLGLGALQGIRSQQAYAPPQTGNSEGTSAVTTTGYSYAGPWLTVENGSVTWRREEDEEALPLGTVSSSGVEVRSASSAAGQLIDGELVYPRTPSSPPSYWVRTIEEAAAEAAQNENDTALG